MAAERAVPATQVMTARGAGPVAALTFDDRPDTGETEDLLDVLAEQDIAAAFCVVGANVLAPAGVRVLRRTLAEVHEPANHTTSCADMGDWPAGRAPTSRRTCGRSGTASATWPGPAPRTSSAPRGSKLCRR